MSSINLSLTEEEILKLPNDGELGRYVRKKFWDLMRQEKEKDYTEYDHCLLCGKISPYTKDTNIFNRIGYVEGGGQCCFNPKECEK